MSESHQNTTWCQKKLRNDKREKKKWQLQPPSNLSLQGNLAENWKLWIQKLELFCTASGIAEKSEAVQCATFLHVAGEEAIKLYNTFVFSEAEKDKIQVLKEKFKDYCHVRRH